MKRWLPLVWAELEALQRRRREHRSRYAGGVRLLGLEDLIAHLDTTASEFESGSDLPTGARRLVVRARADFIIAVDATLAGQLSVASDAMRDVLEIEMLVLDFIAKPTHLQRSLEGSDRDRRTFFAAGTLRKRLRQAGAAEVTRSVFGLDYKAHRAALHVNPTELPIARKVGAVEAWEVDAGWWEIFEHGRRCSPQLRDLNYGRAAMTPVTCRRGPSRRSQPSGLRSGRRTRCRSSSWRCSKRREL
jgi:hypothetical protein